jgi:hypothetical protein
MYENYLEFYKQRFLKKYLGLWVLLSFINIFFSLLLCIGFPELILLTKTYKDNSLIIDWIILIYALMFPFFIMLGILVVCVVILILVFIWSIMTINIITPFDHSPFPFSILENITDRSKKIGKTFLVIVRVLYIINEILCFCLSIYGLTLLYNPILISEYKELINSFELFYSKNKTSLILNEDIQKAWAISHIIFYGPIMLGEFFYIIYFIKNRKDPLYSTWLEENNQQNIVFSGPTNIPDQITVKEEPKKKPKKKNFIRKIYEDIECPLCKEIYDNDDSKVVLNCGHIFHENCADYFITQFCPLCRSNDIEIEIAEEQISESLILI